MAGHNDPFFAFCKAKFKNRQTRSQVASGSVSGCGEAAEESSPRVQFARALKIASSEECKIVIVRPRPVYRINRLLDGKEPRISVLQSKTGRSTLSRQVIPDSACVRLDVLLYDTLELGVILRDYFAM